MNEMSVKGRWNGKKQTLNSLYLLQACALF